MERRSFLQSVLTGVAGIFCGGKMWAAPAPKKLADVVIEGDIYAVDFFNYSQAKWIGKDLTFRELLIVLRFDVNKMNLEDPKNCSLRPVRDLEAVKRTIEADTDDLDPMVVTSGLLEKGGIVYELMYWWCHEDRVANNIMTHFPEDDFKGRTGRLPDEWSGYDELGPIVVV